MTPTQYPRGSEAEKYHRLWSMRPVHYANDGERWITIGGQKADDGKRKGGRPVLIDKDGVIVGGAVPKQTQGKPVGEFGKHVKGEAKAEPKGEASAPKEAKSPTPDDRETEMQAKLQEMRDRLAALRGRKLSPRSERDLAEVLHINIRHYEGELQKLKGDPDPEPTPQPERKPDPKPEPAPTPEPAASGASIADHPEFDRLDRVYRELTDEQIAAKLAQMGRDLAGHHHAAKREFTGNHTRRTGAAVSAQAARDIGQEKLLLGAYREHKSELANAAKPAEQPAKASNPFAEKAAKARAEADRLGKPSGRDAQMAQSFPLGGGFSNGSNKIDRSVDQAMRVVELSKKATQLEAKAAAFDRGEINAQGRRPAKNPAKPKAPERSVSAEEAAESRRRYDENMQKKPWELSLRDYANVAGGGGSANRIPKHVREAHAEYVADAVKNGRPVSPEVLAEYPALKNTSYARGSLAERYARLWSV